MAKLTLTCATEPRDVLIAVTTPDRVGLTVCDLSLTTSVTLSMPEPALLDLDVAAVDRLIAFLQEWRASVVTSAKATA